MLFVRLRVHKGVPHKTQIFIKYFSSSSVKFYYTVADIAYRAISHGYKR
jgi:hypothetical protein